MSATGDPDFRKNEKGIGLQGQVRAGVGGALSRLPERISVHYPLMIKTGTVVAVMLVAFLAGLPIALVAIAGAACSLLTRRVKPEKVYRQIDWEVLLLFIGMFVLIGGAEAAGIAQVLLAAAQAVNLHNMAVFTVITAVLSNLVSNVPAVLLIKPIIPSLPDPTRAWLLLAMASTLAGNVTLVGSVANLIVVEAARKQGVRIGFLEYFRVGLPLTLVTVLLGWLILYRY